MTHRITVKYYNLVRDLTGRGADEVSLEGKPTLGALLDTLTGLHGQAFAEFVLGADGGLNPHVRLFLNDETMMGKCLDRLLADGDAIALFSAISGG
ncbi:MAG: MoaD/ThiS family protein [Bacillota bacterium]